MLESFGDARRSGGVVQAGGVFGDAAVDSAFQHHPPLDRGVCGAGAGRSEGVHVADRDAARVCVGLLAGVLTQARGTGASGDAFVVGCCSVRRSSIAAYRAACAGR